MYIKRWFFGMYFIKKKPVDDYCLLGYFFFFGFLGAVGNPCFADILRIPSATACFLVSLAMINQLPLLKV